MTRLTIFVFFTGLAVQLQAQGLSVEINGGEQGTHYSLRNGKTSLLPGGSLGLLYTFPIKDGLGVMTGITGAVYRTKAMLPDGALFNNYQVDDAGSAFQYSMKTEGYQETQQFFAAGIPIILQYHTPGAGRQFYISGGGKVLLPANDRIHVSARQLMLSGYYPDYNVEVSDLPQHGFGTVNQWTANTTAKLNPAVALTASAGVGFRISPTMRLFSGLYIEYGLTSLRAASKDSMPLVSYSPTGVAGVKGNGVLTMPGAGAMKSLSFGLQVRLAFGPEHAKAVVKKKKSQTPPTAAVPLTVSTDTTMAEDELAIIRKPVVFGVIDEITIPEFAGPHLDDVAAILVQHPSLRISIVGHICNSGTETEDPKVGIARAEAVANYLKARGVSRNRMEVSGVSTSDPVLPNNPGANFQKRRVVIAIK